MYEIIVVQAGFHCGNCKFMDANRIQVIVNRILMFYLALLLLNSGGGEKCLAFPHIVCQNIKQSPPRQACKATCQNHAQAIVRVMQENPVRNLHVISCISLILCHDKGPLTTTSHFCKHHKSFNVR